MHAATAWSESCKAMAGPVIEACTVASGPAGPAALAREIGKRLPWYSFRRLTHIGNLLARMRTQSLEPQPIHRFFADWDASAGRATAFHNHWVVALREHLDRYHQPITRAQPVTALNGEAPRFAVRQGASGLALHEALAADAAAGYRYLPERDLQVVKNWLYKPYGF